MSEEQWRTYVTNTYELCQDAAKVVKICQVPDCKWCDVAREYLRYWKSMVESLDTPEPVN